MVPKGDRLRPLHVRITGHYVLAVQNRLAAQHLDQLPKLRLQHAAFLFQVAAQIERHLIVAAAGGVQALARVAHAGSQLALHEGMNILRVRVDRKLAALNVLPDAHEAVTDDIRLVLLDHAARAQHGCVGDAAFDIFFCHSAVEGNGRVKIICFGVNFFLEPSCPKLHVIASVILF